MRLYQPRWRRGQRQSQQMSMLLVLVLILATLSVTATTSVPQTGKPPALPIDDKSPAHDALLYPAAHHRHLAMDFEASDQEFASFFDEVVIPAQKQRWEQLDPHVFIGKHNASRLLMQDGECSLHVNKRILDADHRVIILGGGPAGLTAAIYAARGGMEPLVIARDGGQLEATSTIDNFPGFAEGIDAVELLETLAKQARKYGAAFRECEVTAVDLECRPFRITCGGAVFTSSAVIVASGASTKWLGAPGEMEFLANGVHTCATCDGYFYRGKHAAVIGGGDTAMEQALFLARMAERVTVVHRRETFRASKAMASRVLNHPNIDILWDTTVKEFLGAAAVAAREERDVAADGSVSAGAGAGAGADTDADGLRGLRLYTRYDDEDEDDRRRRSDTASSSDPDGWEHVLPVDGAFVAIGQDPNTELFAALRRDDYGYIYTVPGSTLTSITGVYAAGDVSDGVYRQAITSAGTGAMAAMDAERWLCEHGC